MKESTVDKVDENKTLRIAICCMGGFSSSTMATHLNKQLKEKGLDKSVFLEFIPFYSLFEDKSSFVNDSHRNRQREVDVALLCPHLEDWARRVTDEGGLSIPVFVLPMRLYGMSNVEHLIEDAEDVLELWNNGTPNVVSFPDEPRSMTAPRSISHRRWAAQQQQRK